MALNQSAAMNWYRRTRSCGVCHASDGPQMLLSKSLLKNRPELVAGASDLKYFVGETTIATSET